MIQIYNAIFCKIATTELNLYSHDLINEVFRMDVKLQTQVFILALLGAMSFVLVFLCLLVDYESKNRKKALLLLELATSLLLLSDAFTYLYWGNPSTLGFWMVRISNFLTYFLIYIEIIGLNIYIHSYVTSKKSLQIQIEKGIYILAGLGIVMLIVSQFNGMFYYFDETNNYYRGDYFFLSYIIPLAMMIMMFLTVMSHRKELSKHIFAAGIAFTVLPLSGAIIQGVIYGISLFNPSIGLSAIVMFALSLVDQNEVLRKTARTEKMTGLPNAHGYLMELEKKIARGEIGKYNAFYFDIIRMGQVNRKYGNQIGDKAIIDYAKSVRDFMIEDEVLGRLGGNFFVAVIRKERTEEFLEFIAGVDILVHTQRGEEKVTLSAVAGIYEIPNDAKSASQIMTYVAMAISNAKNVQKKPYVYLTKELLQEMNEQRQLQELIPKCMEEKEFVAFYQPKVRLSDRTLCGAEALARWRHNGELIPPYKFIPLLEQNDSICNFDFYMLNTACADIRSWLDAGITPPTISVNFSRKNLGNPILSEAIYNVVKSYDIPRELIQIEITETVDEYPIDYLKGVVEALQRYGMTSAIDDFGTGSASIKIFKEVPFDVLKIDKSFIDSVSDKDRSILAHIIEIAKDLNARIIAEGVETKEQLEVLEMLECDEIQGYYFDKPLEKEVFVERIKNPVYNQ